MKEKPLCSKDFWKEKGFFLFLRVLLLGKLWAWSKAFGGDVEKTAQVASASGVTD